MDIPAHDPFLWIKDSLTADRDEYLAYVRWLTRGLTGHFVGLGCREPDDLVQETLAIVIGKLQRDELSDGFPTEDARRGYLFGVAKNIARDWRRKTSQRMKEDSIDDNGPQEPLAVPPVDHIRAECQKLLRRTIEMVTAQLDKDDRQIVMEIYLSNTDEDLSARAARLNMSHATMRKRASRAKQRLYEGIRKAERLADLFNCLGWERSSK